MPNQIHLLFEVSQASLGRPMQRIASRYARYAQRRSETTGHFFERRHHATLVDTDRHLLVLVLVLVLVRNIHVNPVRGGLVQDPSDHPWCSLHDYLGDRSRGATRARCEIAARAVGPGVATRSEVARRFGCSTSAVSQATDRSLRTAGMPGASPAAARSGTSGT